MSDETPTCDKCGAPIETGMMALLCPLRTECALWPDATPLDDELTKAFPPEYTPEQVQRMREHCERRASARQGTGDR
jgi:hypothetical protein